MATLTGTQIANTYKQLLQVGSDNTGLTGTVQSVQDGQGNNSPLQLSQSAVNINGTFQLSGVTLTANASTLNAVADLTGATGIVAVSGGNVYGRTITGGTGVSITNADGTEGNPTIALNTTGVTSASYGPATNIEVNSVGQIVSAGAATSVSVSGVTANTFTGGTFAGTTGDFSSNVSVGGNLVLAGQFSPASLSVTGTINANKISATDATFNSVVSAAFFVGDGSGLVNVPSAEGGTVKTLEAGTGITLYIDAGVTSTVNSSGTIAVSANQNFGTVSVSTALAVTGSALFGIVSATNIDTDELLIAGVSAATVTEVAAVSALTQTNLDSITSINTVVGNVSAVTSVNAAAITSINTVVTNVSAVTSVNAAAITSINTIIGDGSNFATSAELAATSLALATSIGNSNTNITTNANAITSINTVVANVSALTSVNAAAITSINTILESDVSADSGTFNTLTVVTSASVGGTFNVGGNVGIGTTSQAQKLEVNGAIVALGAASSYTNTGLYLQNKGSSVFDVGAWRTGASVAELTFSTDSGSDAAPVERMRLTSSGELGLGETSPAAHLHVNSGTINTVGMFESTDATATLYLIDSNTTGGTAASHGLVTSGDELAVRAVDHISFDIGSTEEMRIVSNGDVGIGTANPSVYGGRVVIAGVAVNGEQTLVIANNSTNQFFRAGINANVAQVAWDDGDDFAFGTASNSTTSGLTNEYMRINSSGNVGIGTTSPDYQLDVSGTTNPRIVLQSTGTASSDDTILMNRIGGTSAANQIWFGDSTSQSTGKIVYDHSNNAMTFHTNGGSEDVRIDSSGNVGIGNTAPAGPLEVLDVNIAGSSGEDGFSVGSSGRLNTSTDDAIAWYMNDSSASAGTHNYIVFRYQGTTIGDIDTIDNSTIRYNTFTGAHWAQFTDHSQPDIPLGTVMSTINEMCNHTQFEYVDDQGQTQKVDIAGLFEIGSTHTIYIDEDGAQAEGTAIAQSTQKRLAKVKVSDTAGDKSVYGVFAGHYKDGDSSVESLGLGAIRIASGVTVENGDLLESAGDGTARPQTGDSADLFKASTIAKVTSTTVIETYDDGSYTVPCTLHCG